MDTQTLAPRTFKIIGRDEDLNIIKQAIADPAGDRHVIYLVGDGGIGKTRILEEIDEFQPAFDPPFIWSGIIDLYHTEYHSPGGLREAIVNGLEDPHNHHFEHYRRIRADYEEKRTRLRGESLEALRREQDKVFQEDYATFAQQHRVVLCFDTVELVQYESDAVQQICQIEDESTVIKTWFLEQVSQLPNAVIIFAGRPKEKIRRDFEEGFTRAGCHFSKRTLNVFSKDETEAYLMDICRDDPELTETLVSELDRLHQISGGRPIYLAILIDLMRYSPTVGTIFDEFDGKKSEQSDKKESKQPARKKTKQEVGAKLVELFESLPRPLDQMMHWLIRTRKGLDANLLRHLEPTWSEEEVQDNLEKMRSLAIVKLREKTNQLFLHDEIYDLVDLYYLNYPRFADEFQPILDYYRQLGDPAQLENDDIVARLYYELRLDPKRGYYEHYVWWDDAAINRHDIGADMRMRDEVLNFLNRYTIPPLKDPSVVDRIDRADIDRDCAVRWVKRYFSRGQYRKADKVAEDLRNSTHLIFHWDTVDDPIYKASLLAIWGRILIHLGKTEQEERERLRDAITLLTKPRDWDEFETKWQPLILGQVYNYAGLMHRQRRRFGTAIKYYTAAINQFRRTTAELDMAITLTNQAYAQALLGNVSAAENQIRDALNLHRIRLAKQNRKYDYWSTLSLNARGAIYLEAGKPHLTIENCKQSRSQFDQLDETRGVALANLNLGEAYRMIGSNWRQDETHIDEALKAYQESQQALDEALQFFRDAPAVELLETLLEQSKLKRDWGLLKQHLGQQAEAKEDIEKAFKPLKEGIARAEEEWRVQKMDCLEDMVGLYVLQHRFEEANRTIAEAEALVPHQYLLEEAVGFREIKEPVEDYWNVLARLELHRARMTIFEAFNYLPHLASSEPTDPSDKKRAEALLKAMEYYAKALTYFIAFSPELTAHEGMFAEIYNVLKGLNIPELQGVRKRVVAIDKLYPTIDLSPLLHHIDQTLGATPDIEDVPLL